MTPFAEFLAEISPLRMQMRNNKLRIMDSGGTINVSNFDVSCDRETIEESNKKIKNLF